MNAEAHHPADFRIVPCACCGTEGRIYERVTVYERNAAPHDDDVDVGPCPCCDGAGGEIIATDPIEIEDISEFVA